MVFKQVIEAFEVLDSAQVDGAQVAALLRDDGVEDITIERAHGERGYTDFVKAVIPGVRGRSTGGDAPTLGIIGRLGGLGARPARIGFVSDGDGALAALACAMKLGRMRANGDLLPGDVIISTHICPHAPIRPHQPVPFMGSPVDSAAMNAHEVDARMEAILSIDTTKGNRIINARGFAIAPTVKEGWILRVSESLLEIMGWVTGRPPLVFALTMQDITPYGNNVFHLNSILQPATATAAPVVGVAITTETPVPGSGTGVSHLVDIECAARFCLEVAKAYGAGDCAFYDPAEFAHLVQRYGSMTHLQTAGKEI